MLYELENMDKGLKEFLRKKIFEERNASNSDIVYLASMEGYEETQVINALNVFMYSGLIGEHQGILPLPKVTDFLASDTRYQELLSQKYL